MNVSIISSWNEVSQIARIEKNLRYCGIAIDRFNTNIPYKSNCFDFESWISGDIIIAYISPDFFKSLECLYALLYNLKRNSGRFLFFPILSEGLKQADLLIEYYIRHWSAVKLFGVSDEFIQIDTNEEKLQYCLQNFDYLVNAIFDCNPVYYNSLIQDRYSQLLDKIDPLNKMSFLSAFNCAKSFDSKDSIMERIEELSLLHDRGNFYIENVRANMAIENKDFGAAISILNILKNKFPNEVMPFIKLGDLYNWESHSLYLSMKNYNYVLAINPYFSLVHTNISYLYTNRTVNYGKALFHLKEVLVSGYGDIESILYNLCVLTKYYIKDKRSFNEYYSYAIKVFPKSMAIESLNYDFG